MANVQKLWESRKGGEVLLIVKNTGFAKLNRETTKKLFKDVLAYRIYSLIVMNATHKEYKYNGILLKPGQWVRSYSKLVDDLEYIDGRGGKKPNKSSISRAIDRLVDANIIKIEYPIIIANRATVHATDNATINATLFTLLEIQSYQGSKASETVNHATVHATDNATDSASKTRINKQELNNKNNNMSIQQAEQFNLWWNLYNKKASEVKCEIKFKQLLKKYNYPQIVDGTKKYLQYMQQNNIDKRYQKNPLNFLNHESFMDEYEELTSHQEKGIPNLIDLTIKD